MEEPQLLEPPPKQNGGATCVGESHHARLCNPALLWHGSGDSPPALAPCEALPTPSSNFTPTLTACVDGRQGCYLIGQ